MPALKGTRPPNAGKGRPRGAANTMTRSLRDMIFVALDDAGASLSRRASAPESGDTLGIARSNGLG